MSSIRLSLAAGLAVGVATLPSIGQVRSADDLVCGKARAAAARLRTHAPIDPVGAGMACDAEGLTDLLNCNLDIEVIPSLTRITGSNTFTIKSLADNLTTFTFRLSNEFSISAATINGSTSVAVATPTITTRVATLDRPYNTGEIFTLRIDYSGVPTSGSGFGAIEFGTQSGLPLIESLSEPYYAYTWWPCKDGDLAAVGDNSDKFTVQTAITAPDTLTSVAVGLLQGVDVIAGGKKRFRWSSNYPITTYLVFFCTTVYNQWQQNYTYPLPGGGTGSMPVQFSVYPAHDTAGNRAGWEKAVAMIGVYSSLFGQYPFINEKYGIYEFGFGGGMEHQTYTGQGGFGEGLTAHELGHQWWGDNVTCKTWMDIWLNEGFASYCESLWEQYKPGSSGWPAYYSSMNGHRPSDVSGTVYCTNVSSIGSIFSGNNSYNKPSWVLHSLRHVIGDTAFFNTLTAYRAAYQGSAATTDQFAAIAAANAGRDLTWFFQEWIYGPGAPAYASGWQNVTINGQNYLRLRLRQTQTAYPVFTMPVDIRVNFASGNQTYTVWNDAATEWFVIPISAPATGIVVDENSWILTTAKTSESYVNGPPKVVQASILPGATIAAGSAPSQVTVTFSENVNAPAAAFTLVGPGGSVPLSVLYNAANFTSTLNAGAALAPGVYTLTVADSVGSVAAAAALDGEIAPPQGPSSLPSGNGQAGGAAIWSFTVEGIACYANCDGSTSAPSLNVNDFQCFLNRYAAGDSYANCDGSTIAPVLNVNDFQCFLNKYAAGCP